jgi:hypothetical protein
MCVYFVFGKINCLDCQAKVVNVFRKKYFGSLKFANYVIVDVELDVE